MGFKRQLIFAASLIVHVFATVTSIMGPSLTIFAFIYLSKFSISAENASLTGWDALLIHWLPLASVLVGAVSYMAKQFFINWSHRIDQHILPVVDALVLIKLESGNLFRSQIRYQSLLFLKVVHKIFFFLMLAFLVSLFNPALGLVTVLMTLLTLVYAMAVSRKHLTSHNILKRRAKLDRLIDQSLMAFLIFGCIMLVPREAWLQTGIALFLIARVFGNFKHLAQAILTLHHARQFRIYVSNFIKQRESRRTTSAAPASSD